jgi:hypothetical protein
MVAGDVVTIATRRKHENKVMTIVASQYTSMRRMTRAVSATFKCSPRAQLRLQFLLALRTGACPTCHRGIPTAIPT